MLQDKVEGKRAGRDYQINPSCRVFATQKLPHPHAVLRLGKALGIEELREQLQSIPGLGIQAGAEAAHELLVSGLLAIADREDEDLVRFAISDGSRRRARRQDQTYGDKHQLSALHVVTECLLHPVRWRTGSSETGHTAVGDR
jgi:hypothetical protein